MDIKIAVLAGDGIGPEVTLGAMAVLKAVGKRFGHTISTHDALIGGIAIDKTGNPLPDESIKICQDADAIFLGAIGGPKWDNPDASVRPEQGILKIRKTLGLYANIRPVNVYPELSAISPLKEHLLKNVDFIVVRELTGGIYFGKKTKEENRAVDECVYTTDEIIRITESACQLAMRRSKKIASIDKANVLETSRLWRKTVSEYVAKNYPEIELKHELVDSTAMRLIQNPAQYDVILTENMFGDILTDEASVISGSMGLLPSASMGIGNKGLYEPIHGSAPDIAGKGLANPLASILSIAMMFRLSFNLLKEAALIEAAVHETIKQKILTPDLNRDTKYSTDDVVNSVLANLSKI